MISAGDFRNGITIEFEGNIYQIIEFQHVKPGKGAAFVCRLIGIILLAGVIICLLPAMMPRLIGLEIYNVENDSMAPEIPAKKSDKIKFISVAPAFAEAIERVYEEVSISTLFK